jgi:hypothetical protein
MDEVVSINMKTYQFTFHDLMTTVYVSKAGLRLSLVKKSWWGISSVKKSPRKYFTYPRQQIVSKDLSKCTKL